MATCGNAPGRGHAACIYGVACGKFYGVMRGTWSMSFVSWLAPALILREGDRQRLADLARLPSVPSGLAKRARMVLLASAAGGA
jgi:hypothetical protein